MSGLEAGAVGLALSYAVTLMGMFQWGVRQSAEVENLVRPFSFFRTGIKLFKKKKKAIVKIYNTYLFVSVRADDLSRKSFGIHRAGE